MTVNTKHFAAVATDHPGKYEFKDLTINITSTGPAVVIVEKIDAGSVDYDYEITAVGHSGQFHKTNTDAPIKWDPVKFVQGGITFKNNKVIESITWLKADGTLRRAPIQMSSPNPTMKFAKTSRLVPNGVRLYRVKLK